MVPSTEKLVQIARTVSENAYAPYSKFAVGCAIVSEDHNTYAACNVENVSLGLTICAERAATSQGVAKEGDKFRINRVVIYTPTDKPISPCGACRQVFREFGNDFEVLSVCNSDKEIKFSISYLLPQPPDIDLP